jgi:GT2 family glycosyltransferase
LRELAYETYEVVVVDNAPRTTATREVFDDAARGDDRFRYVLEPAPGLSRARNRGLAESTAAYVAFVDDDALPDIRWLQAIADGFARDARVALVTGLAPPAELDHPAQEYFDRRYPAAADPRRRLFDLSSDASSRLYPFSAGVFGCGANFAVDRRVFESLGAFDESLGAGTPSGGGEDLDAFVRVLLAGYAIAREPNAVAWHVNRLDAHALRRQLYTYGTGLTAYLTKFLVDRRTSREIISRLGAGARRVPQVWDADEISGGPPFGYFLAEAAGMVAGPVAYFRGRLRQSRVPREDAVCS